MGLFQPFHVDVELVSLVLSLKQVDFVGVLIPDTEVFAFLGAIGHRDPLIVGDELDICRLSSADDGVVGRNGDVTRRGTFVIAEVHVIQGPKHAHLPPLSLPGIDDVPHALHV